MCKFCLTILWHIKHLSIQIKVLCFLPWLSNNCRTGEQNLPYINWYFSCDWNYVCCLELLVLWLDAFEYRIDKALVAAGATWVIKVNIQKNTTSDSYGTAFLYCPYTQIIVIIMRWRAEDCNCRRRSLFFKKNLLFVFKVCCWALWTSASKAVWHCKSWIILFHS